MKLSTPTQLERLHRQLSSPMLILDPELQHGQWVSPLLPTRRFGPAGWVTFTMRTITATTMSGDFLAWSLLSHESPSLLAHLARPLADTFGLVAPFELSDASIPADVVPALGRLGDGYFSGAEPEVDDVNSVSHYLASLSEPMQSALRIAAPDFMQWAGIGRPIAPNS